MPGKASALTGMSLPSGEHPDNVAFARDARRFREGKRQRAHLPSTSAVAAAAAESAAAEIAATAAESTAAPVTAAPAAHVGLTRIVRPSAGIAAAKRTALIGGHDVATGLVDHRRAAIAEHLVAEPRAAEASEQSAPKTAAAAIISGAITVAAVARAAGSRSACSRRNARTAAVIARSTHRAKNRTQHRDSRRRSE